LSFLHPGDPVINHFDHGIIPTQWAYFTMGCWKVAADDPLMSLEKMASIRLTTKESENLVSKKNDPPINRYKNIEHQ
jgi:hypothetical protein